MRRPLFAAKRSLSRLKMNVRGHLLCDDSGHPQVLLQAGCGSLARPDGPTSARAAWIIILPAEGMAALGVAG